MIKVTGSSSQAISIPPVPAQDPSPLNLASVKFLLSTCDSVSWFLESTASASLLLGEADGILAWAEHLASCLDALQVCKQRRTMIRISSLPSDLFLLDFIGLCSFLPLASAAVKRASGRGHSDWVGVSNASRWPLEIINITTVFTLSSNPKVSNSSQIH